MKHLMFFLLFIASNVISQAQNTESALPASEKSRIIKTDFFAPITGNLSFSYEQQLMNSVTLEGTLGIIGVGIIKDNLHPAGLFLKVGPRFYFSPDYTFDGLRRTNDFQGAYFKPEIIYSGFGFDYDTYNPTSGVYGIARGSNNSFALMLNFGKQWVLANVVTIDLYAGIGYGGSIVDAPDYYNYGSNSYNEEYLVPQKYSHLQPSNDVPLAFEAGFNIGWLLK